MESIREIDATTYKEHVSDLQEEIKHIMAKTIRLLEGIYDPGNAIVGDKLRDELKTKSEELDYYRNEALQDFDLAQYENA